MAFFINARVSAACHESNVPADAVERLSVESMLQRYCLEREVPDVAQVALALPILSLKGEFPSAMNDARRVVQDRLAATFPVGFQDDSDSSVIWIPTRTGHEAVCLAFNDLGAQRTFKITSDVGGTTKEYTGVIVFIFHALGVDATV